MGQYHRIMNLERCEYLHPEGFGEGQKLTEFGFSGGTTMAALAGLLATSSGRGFGDLFTFQRESSQGITYDDPAAWIAECDYTAEWFTEKVLGRWAGDRIAIVGDYYRPEDLRDWPDGQPGAAWSDPKAWTNISRLGLVLVGCDPESRDEARRLIHQADHLESQGHSAAAPRVEAKGAFLAEKRLPA